MIKRTRTLFVTQFAVLLALEAVVCFTPLGSLPIGPIVATLMYLPVVAAALLMGVGAGAAMGAAAGLFSFLVWTFMPPNPLTAFVFTPFYSLGPFQGNFASLIICFVPRVLVGVITGFSILLFKKQSAFAYGVSAALGTFACTLLVLGGIYIFFGAPYAEANGLGYGALLGALGMVVLTNGLLETALAALVGSAVCRPLMRFVLRR